ncbi:hypothetical protein M441DRAFT_29842 [Trichoderma asperellum CBS 433.97]|uniref:Uncharacterized protein n=2 Tax=Trichoderma asperellum TaxID=101201 RepID=A0A2T3Z117_TRIA4|nr:hypothetical protein M441DRAFT_29842 [Trichoderma asperellum CBS 433.97]PTB38484.1 hypothetical protein M441DRAFT_29842 [Trichoderma asperellum CBS 433.97]
MDESEIWLSDEDGDFDEDDEAASDPTFFSLGLTYQGQPGAAKESCFSLPRRLKEEAGLHRQLQCKAIIHGEMGPSLEKHATLLVYEFKFNSYRRARIKEADVLFEFHAMKGRAGGPSVRRVAPYGHHKMQETMQSESSKYGLELTVGPNIPAVNVGLTLSGEAAVDKVTKHYTEVTGDNPQSDDWGNYFQARFFLSENNSQTSGIPAKLCACILLERDDDEDFICVPYLKVTPNFTTMVTSLFSTRAPDDPIIFSVAEPPFNELDTMVDIDVDNLGATDLDQLWDCTACTEYGHSVKQPKSRNSECIPDNIATEKTTE